MPASSSKWSEPCAVCQSKDICFHKEVAYGEEYELHGANKGRQRGWIDVRSQEAMERMPEGSVERVEGYTEEEVQILVDKLLRWGLKEWEVTVLMERDVNKLSLQEVADLYGYTSTTAVMRIYRIANRKAKLAYQAYEGWKS